MGMTETNDEQKPQGKKIICRDLPLTRQ